MKNILALQKLAPPAGVMGHHKSAASKKCSGLSLLLCKTA